MGARIRRLIAFAASTACAVTIPDVNPAVGPVRYAPVNHSAKRLREAGSQGLVYDPYGHGVNFD